MPEMLPGYDKWRTSVPDDPPVFAECDQCGCEIYVGDEAYEYDGEVFCSTGCVVDALFCAGHISYVNTEGGY